MAFDGGFLHKLIDELNTAVDSHVDKIYQPSRDELVFLLRKKGFVKRLLISVKQGSARIQFTENKYENPASPPMFCMLMRKYLSAAKVLEFSQKELERIAEISFSASNEMGDIVTLKLIAEFIGNKTNIILLSSDGKIIDSLRHSDPETADRFILPGAVYEYPASQNKLNPITNRPTIISAFEKECDKTSSLLSVADGFSPLICRELVYKTEVSGNFQAELDNLLTDLTKQCNPLLLSEKDGKPYDFSYTDISQYGDKFDKKSFETFSDLLDAFYTARDIIDRMRHSAADIIKLISNLKLRAERRLALRLNDLKSCEDRETLRLYGELLKANLYRIENGASFAEVENYYDDLKPIRIPLNPALSPQNNAAKYFKDYKKSYTAEQILTKLAEEDRNEIIYFDSLLESIERCTTLAELSEIRDELAEVGYIKRQGRAPKSSKTVPKFKEYLSNEGYRILVGKNNKQNDYLTTVLASKNDLWFHVKNIPGSHVIVMSGGKEVSDETILYAAGLAAANSKASDSAQVPVDYTPVKFVKKPNGAKPGMVIYTTNKTVFVTPQN